MSSMLEEIVANLTARNVVLGFGALVVAYVLREVVLTWLEERQIQALGGHAPRVKKYLPWGIDTIIASIEAQKANKTYEGWLRRFSNNGRGRYTVELEVINERIIFTAEPDNIKAILATQFQDYGKGEPFRQQWHDFLGDSIFTTDLDQWHASRQLIRPQFIKDRVGDLVVFEEHVKILMESIANGGVKGMPGVATDGVACGRSVQLHDLFLRYTLDAATHFLLGRSVESQTVPLQNFAEAFADVQRVQNTIALAGPASRFVPRKAFNAGLKIINDFVNPFIDEALSLSPEELASKTKAQAGYTFLHELAGFTRDRKVLRDQLVAVLLAGRDTTASGLAWTFYELGRHPEIYQRLRQEVIEMVGLNRPPTYKDLKSMKYLQNTMNEMLRLYPAVPFNVRLALKDTTLPKGGGADGQSPIGILKNTPIGYSTLLMHRREDLYPPNSDHLRFNPERWFSWQPKPWTYIPFNGGPRICIGQQFALTEMGYTIVRMLQRFERCESFMQDIDGGNPSLKSEIVLQPGQGVMTGFWSKDTASKEKVLVDI